MILSISALSFLSTVIFYIFPNLPFFIFDWLCVFAPMTGYVDQLIKMCQTKNSTKFRPGSSIVLLFSNFLRIVYWSGSQFANYLFWQSVVTIIVHFALCNAYFSFLDPKIIAQNHEGEPNRTSLQQSQQRTEKSFITIQPLHATTFCEFFLILVIDWFAILAILLFLCFFFDFTIIAQFVGLISNLIDSLQTFPPFFQVVFKGDISSITNMLALQFIAATCFKAVLFFCRPVPWPFRVGVGFQAFFVTFISIEYFRKTFFKAERLKQYTDDDTSSQYVEEEEDAKDDVSIETS